MKIHTRNTAEVNLLLINIKEKNSEFSLSTIYCLLISVQLNSDLDISAERWPKHLLVKHKFTFNIYRDFGFQSQFCEQAWLCVEVFMHHIQIFIHSFFPRIIQDFQLIWIRF